MHLYMYPIDVFYTYLIFIPYATQPLVTNALDVTASRKASPRTAHVLIHIGYIQTTYGIQLRMRIGYIKDTYRIHIRYI